MKKLKINSESFESVARVSALEVDVVDTVSVAEIAEVAEVANVVSSAIPQEVYLSLPDMIKELVDQFSTSREKDVFFTGLLGIMSGCISNLYTIYDDARVRANLYMFVSAPAGSGKGKLNFLRNLIQPFHDYNKKKYDSEGALIVPSNITSAKLIGILKASENRGILFETEADTLSAALKGEHGNFSHILRNAFHHEVIAIARKGDNQFDELENPELSVLLSGTPAQITRLIPNSEDGLFSRFNFYHFEEKSLWKSLSYDRVVGGVGLSSYFTNKGNELCDLLVKFSDRNVDVDLRFTEEQLNIFNAHYSDLNESYNSEEDRVNDIVFRNGLKTAKIAMILTFFRKYDEIMESEMVYCDQIDFENALKISDLYLEHNMTVFHDIMPSRRGSSKPFNKEEAFLSNLPDTFSTAQAMQIGMAMGLKERTVRIRLASACKSGKLGTYKAGSYFKINS